MLTYLMIFDLIFFNKYSQRTKLIETESESEPQSQSESDTESDTESECSESEEPTIVFIEPGENCRSWVWSYFFYKRMLSVYKM